MQQMNRRIGQKRWKGPPANVTRLICVIVVQDCVLCEYFAWCQFRSIGKWALYEEVEASSFEMMVVLACNAMMNGFTFV